MIPEWTERWIILAFSRESSVITYIPSLGRLMVSIIYKGISHGPSLWLTSLASASNTAYPVLNLNVTYGGLFAKLCLTHVIPWTGALQAPPSMGICRQDNWSGLPFPSPEDLPDPGVELWSPALQADSLLTALHRYFKLNTSPAHTVSLPDLLFLCAVSSENSFTATWLR